MTYAEKYHAEASSRHRNYVSKRRPPVEKIEKMGAFGRTLSLKVTLIDSALPGKATIFGATTDLTETLNTSNNVKVELSESTHTAIKTSLLQNPMTVEKWQLVASSQLQLNQIWKVFDNSPFGREEATPVQPLNYQDPSDKRTDMVIIRNGFQTIKDTTGVEINVLAGEYFTLAVTVSQIMNLSGALTGAAMKKSAE